MKNLNFISAKSSLKFTTIYLYYIYVIICFFLDSILKLSNIRLGIKTLFRQKLFLKRSKKSSRIVVCQTSSRNHGPFFVFLLKNSSKAILSLRIPMCRKINK